MNENDYIKKISLLHVNVKSIVLTYNELYVIFNDDIMKSFKRNKGKYNIRPRKVIRNVCYCTDSRDIVLLDVNHNAINIILECEFARDFLKYLACQENIANVINANDDSSNKIIVYTDGTMEFVRYNKFGTHNFKTCIVQEHILL